MKHLYRKKGDIGRSHEAEVLRGSADNVRTVQYVLGFEKSKLRGMNTYAELKRRGLYGAGCGRVGLDTSAMVGLLAFFTKYFARMK
jgi:hypothetical protein